MLHNGHLLACQLSKIERHNQAPVGEFPTQMTNSNTFTKILLVDLRLSISSNDG